MHPNALDSHPHLAEILAQAPVDPHAINIVKTLHDSGYQAYIVGGGVRDLLLGLRPKDFDIATDAKPEEVKACFENCRLIGKRFRLAHIYYRRHIIEVSTFRGHHNDTEDATIASTKEGIITRDNVYGTLEQDAVRRDFTINALYYDPVNQHMIDLTEGLTDFENKTLRLIGEPKQRFTEDPIRVLRALRIANKLGFNIHPDTYACLEIGIRRLDKIPPGRRFDEYGKILLHGQSQLNYPVLCQHKILSYFFPHAATEASEWSEMIQLALKNTDERVAMEKGINPAFLIAVFLWPHLQDLLKSTPIPEETSPRAFFHHLIDQVLKEQTHYTSLPKRFSATIRHIWGLQQALERRRPRSIPFLLKHVKFRAAYDFLLLRAATGTAPQKIADWWTEIQTLDEIQQAAYIENLKPVRRKK